MKVGFFFFVRSPRKTKENKKKLTLNICLPWCQVPSTATRMYSPPLTGPKASGGEGFDLDSPSSVAVVVVVAASFSSSPAPPPPSLLSPSSSSSSALSLPSTTHRGIPLSATSLTSSAPGPGNSSSTGIFFCSASAIASRRQGGQRRSPSKRLPRGTSTFSRAADSSGTVASLLRIS